MVSFSFSVLHVATHPIAGHLPSPQYTDFLDEQDARNQNKSEALFHTAGQTICPQHPPLTISD
jgi:hypothetical protein